MMTESEILSSNKTDSFLTPHMMDSKRYDFIYEGYLIHFKSVYQFAGVFDFEISNEETGEVWEMMWIGLDKALAEIDARIYLREKQS